MCPDWILYGKGPATVVKKKAQTLPPAEKPQETDDKGAENESGGESDSIETSVLLQQLVGCDDAASGDEAFSSDEEP